jgi:hypothetical protein
LIGEYRARCLFSKTWVLREAAVNKIQLMLTSDFSRDPPGLAHCLPALCAVIKVGVEDKIQQVLFAAVSLMDELFEKLRRCDHATAWLIVDESYIFSSLFFLCCF